MPTESFNRESTNKVPAPQQGYNKNGNADKLAARLAAQDKIFSRKTPGNIPTYKVESNTNIEHFRVLAKKTIDENHSEDSSTPEKKAEAIERLAQSMLSLAISKIHRPYKVE